MKKKFLVTSLCMSVFMISGSLYFASNKEQDIVEEDVKIEDATSKFNQKESIVVFESSDKRVLQDANGNELILRGDLSKFTRDDMMIYSYSSETGEKEVFEINSDDIIE